MRHTVIRLLGMVWIAMFAAFPLADAGAMHASKSSPVASETPGAPAGHHGKKHHGKKRHRHHRRHAARHRLRASISASLARPAAPTGLKVVSTGDQTVSLDWNDSSGSFGHYQVYRDNKLIADGPSASGYTDSGLTNGQSYGYRVSAGSSPTYSTWTSIVSGSPRAPAPTIPVVPSGLRVASTGDRTVTLDWNDNTGSFGHYQVYRNDQLISDGPSASSYTDTGLTNGQSYGYRVSAGANPTYSAWTTVVSGSPGALTPTPTPTPTTTPTPTPTPTPVANLWAPNLASNAIGFSPTGGSPISGFNYGTWDIYAGGKVDVQYSIDGATHAFRSSMSAGSTGTQRAEQVPTFDPAGQGTTFWLGFDLTIPTWSNPTNWGPLVMQLKRDGLGNGPIGLDLHNGNMIITGGTGVAGASKLDLGPIPAAGTKTRIVMGFYLDPTNGWVEGWRDGVSKGHVAPWVSKDTSSDGPGNFGSTLTGGVGVYLKLGAYRGSGQSPIDLRYADLRSSSTRSGAM